MHLNGCDLRDGPMIFRYIAYVNLLSIKNPDLVAGRVGVSVFIKTKEQLQTDGTLTRLWRLVFD